MSFTEERDLAVRAARRAADLIEMHAGSLADEQVKKKGASDLVTFVDTRSQEIILEILEPAFPAYGVWAEEGEEGGTSTGEDASYRWVIDPIDGTTNFAHGFPPYAVSIGLLDTEARRPVVGVVLEVARGELFTAIRGEGLYVDGERARVSEVEGIEDGLITTGFPFREFSYVDEYLDSFERFMRAAQGVRRPGVAAMDLAYVACGRFEGFFEIGLYPWDIAAGILLVEEGGGRVTDLSGAPLELAPFQEEICASNGRLHEQMLHHAEPLAGVYDD